MKTLEKWLYQPQEEEGSYEFSGSFFVTAGVQHSLTEIEIFDIYLFIQAQVKQRNNIDYLQVFVNVQTGQKLFFIDQLNKEMISSGKYALKDNYCTLLLAQEY